jgi:hypothetical protein
VPAEPDAARAERIARAITARIDADGYPHLTSTDPAVPLDADYRAGPDARRVLDAAVVAGDRSIPRSSAGAGFPRPILS